MIRNFEDFQKLGQTNIDAAMKMFGEWNKGWQAIAAEMSGLHQALLRGEHRNVREAALGQVGRAGGRDPDGLRQARLRRLHASDVEDRWHVRRSAKEAYKPVEKALQNGAEPSPGRSAAAMKTRARLVPGLFMCRLASPSYRTPGFASGALPVGVRAVRHFVANRPICSTRRRCVSLRVRKARMRSCSRRAGAACRDHWTDDWH